MLAIGAPGAAVAGQFARLSPSPANLPPSAAVEPLAAVRDQRGEL
jgi:hypothetical protein